MMLTWCVLFAGVPNAIPITPRSVRPKVTAVRVTKVLNVTKVRPRYRHLKVDLLQTIIKGY